MDDMLEAARSVMATTVARWEHLVASVPADVLERPPAPGEWSAAQCLAHLLFTERHLFSVRLRNLLAGEDIVPYDPKAPGGNSSSLKSAKRSKTRRGLLGDVPESIVAP